MGREVATAAEGQWALGPGPGFGSRSWHSSVLGVLLAEPGDSEQEQTGKMLNSSSSGTYLASSVLGQSPAP